MEEKAEERFHYGGQAVIEGVMIRGRRTLVTAVRQPDKEIVVTNQPLTTAYTGRIRKTPILRGIVVLIETLILGAKSLFYSANVSLEKEQEKISAGMIGGVVAVSIISGVALFFIAPLFLTRLLNPYIDSPLIFNLIEGGIRLTIFLIYLKSMALLADIRRVFAYHGAEHKAVNTYEDGAPLEVEAAREYSTAHPRCGSSFLFLVLIIAIFVFALIGLPSIWMMVLSRIILIPIIAGIAYEITRFTADRGKTGLTRTLLAPGLWLQSLTTREPDDNQLEVALSALKKAVEIDQLGETVQVPVERPVSASCSVNC